MKYTTDKNDMCAAKYDYKYNIGNKLIYHVGNNNLPVVVRFIDHGDDTPFLVQLENGNVFWCEESALCPIPSPEVLDKS